MTLTNRTTVYCLLAFLLASFALYLEGISFLRNQGGNYAAAAKTMEVYLALPAVCAILIGLAVLFRKHFAGRKMSVAGLMVVVAAVAVVSCYVVTFVVPNWDLLIGWWTNQPVSPRP